MQVLTTPATTDRRVRARPERVLLLLQRPVGLARPRPRQRAALAMVTGADIWEINANESMAYEYSRYNYNVTELYHADALSLLRPQPGDRRDRRAGTDRRTKLQILGTNDFHGRIARPTGAEAGARCSPGRSSSCARQNPNTVFAAAGDLIGASTFESFIQQRQADHRRAQRGRPRRLGRGQPRVRPGLRRPRQPGDGAVRRRRPTPRAVPSGSTSAPTSQLKATGDPALPATWIKDFGGVEVGFIGAVTEDLPGLVSPGRHRGHRGRPTSSTRPTRTADELKARGRRPGRPARPRGCADDAATPRRPTRRSDFGKIVNGVNPDVDAIVSGHTHLAYNHPIPVPEWVRGPRRHQASGGLGGPVRLQPQPAGVHRSTPTTGEVPMSRRSSLQPRVAPRAGHGADYPADAATKAIVDDAVAEADVLGARGLGKIGGAVQPGQARQRHHGEPRRRVHPGQPGRRGAALGDRSPEPGAAQIAFMNPGGLRPDMVGIAARRLPADLTYKQAAIVQPFANTLVNMDMTGAQIKTVLEQQWQRDARQRPVAAVPAARASRRASATPTTRPVAEGAAASRACGSTGRRSTRPRPTR